jgi:hypothetical protein
MSAVLTHPEITIENVRLFDEVQQRTNELRQRTDDLSEALEQQTATSEVLQVIRDDRRRRAAGLGAARHQAADAGKDDLDGNACSLWPEVRSVIGFESESTSRGDGISTENSLVCLACDCARAATVPLHRSNYSAGRTRLPLWARAAGRTRRTCGTCGTHRTGRTGRTGWSLLTPFGFEGILPATSERQ